MHFYISLSCIFQIITCISLILTHLLCSSRLYWSDYNMNFFDFGTCILFRHVLLCFSKLYWLDCNTYFFDFETVLYFSALYVSSNWWWFREWDETSNFYVASNPDYPAVPRLPPTLFAAPSIPLVDQLRPLILHWEVSEVVLAEQTRQIWVKIYLHYMSVLNPL